MAILTLLFDWITLPVQSLSLHFQLWVLRGHCLVLLINTCLPFVSPKEHFSLFNGKNAFGPHKIRSKSLSAIPGWACLDVCSFFIYRRIDLNYIKLLASLNIILPSFSKSCLKIVCLFFFVIVLKKSTVDLSCRRDNARSGPWTECNYLFRADSAVISNAASQTDGLGSILTGGCLLRVVTECARI